jgi:mannose-6-phosphate isomerase-like protein (cupin superfamily)
MDALVLNVGEGRAIPPIGPVRMLVKEDGTRTRGTLGIAESEVPPNVPTPPLHIHHAHEEGFYVLEGELEFKVGAETIRAAKGTLVMVPIGVPHTFSNPGKETVRFLTTFTPPQYLTYFEEVGNLFRAGTPDAAQLRELMARYDTEVVGQ